MFFVKAVCSAFLSFHYCVICKNLCIKNNRFEDDEKLRQLSTLGTVILMRSCQWKNAKKGIEKKSPYSNFYYTKIITHQMILDSVMSGQFFGLLEVDIFTPEAVKREFEKINFATIFDKITPNREMLSDSMADRCEKYGVKFPLNRQLTLVYASRNYLITSEMLQYYLCFGMQVQKIHYCIQYQRSKPLKKFIDLSMWIYLFFFALLKRV